MQKVTLSERRGESFGLVCPIVTYLTPTTIIVGLEGLPRKGRPEAGRPAATPLSINDTDASDLQRSNRLVRTARAFQWLEFSHKFWRFLFSGEQKFLRDARDPRLSVPVSLLNCNLKHIRNRII